jgi:hypothetical protein
VARCVGEADGGPARGVSGSDPIPGGTHSICQVGS